MKLVVGLGNPGSGYKRTRHNIGWRTIANLDLDFRKETKFNAQMVKDGDVIYFFPLTFMNNSGISVRAVMNYYKIEMEDIIVIYDDIDLPFGTVRLRSTGSSAGHNGIKSLIEHLGTKNFARVRVGVAPAYEVTDTADFVLKKFSSAEEEQMPELIELVLDGVNKIIKSGITKKTHEDLTIELKPKDN